jgi:16S rRNA (adenine1518-N6/adenine1519-N6)-dimethyltransferase
MKLLESELPFDTVTVMVQKEVAQRLCAPAGGKDCGAITVAVAYRGEAEMLFTVPADRFFPAPKVDSAVVRIKLYREKPVVPDDEETFFATVRAAFSQRRKTLLNSLSTGFPNIGKDRLAEFIDALGLRPDIRGEKLTVAEFAALSNLIFTESKE